MPSLPTRVRRSASTNTLVTVAAIGAIGVVAAPASAVVGQCCMPSGLCLDLEEDDCVASGGAFTLGLVCAAGASGPFDMSGVLSRNEAGDPQNHRLEFDVAQMQGRPLGTPVRLTGISWDVVIDAIPPSYLSEACMGFGDVEGEYDVVICPGEGDNYSGTGAYSGGMAVDLVLSAGVLFVECFESYDDFPAASDAVYLGGSWIGVTFALSCNPAVQNVTKDTWHPTIQEAIDAADDYDLLHASPRTYFETIDFLGKAVTVQGASSDPEDTRIDGAGAGGRVVTMQGVPGGPTLSRFTIVGGVAPAGGGILIDGSAGWVTVVDCVVTGNLATNGGGIAVRNGAQPLVFDTVIRDNAAIGAGGAVWVGDGSGLHIVDSTLEQNIAGSGGAVSVTAGSTAILDRLLIDLNSSSSGAGAVDSNGGDVTLLNCLISRSASEAPGVAAVTSRGGGSVSMANCTVVHNAGDEQGGVAGQNIDVSSSIVWYNAPAQIEPDPTITVRYSDVQGGWAGSGAHNIAADPMFVSPSSNFRLTEASPCVNAGEEGQDHACLPECAVAVLPPLCLDLDQISRLQECRVDMGAYESHFYTDCNENGISDACDVSPYYGFICTAFPELVPHLPGNASIGALTTAVTIWGNDDGMSGQSIAWASLPLDVEYGTFAFDVNYWSEDDPCSGGGDYDYPVLHLDGTFYGLNHGGTLSGPSDGSCTGGGTIGNGSQGGGHFVVDLEALAGPGPYVVGLGVSSVDSYGGPGVLTFSGFRVVSDANGNGMPDDCDCFGDTDGNQFVDVDDLLSVILDWGTDGAAHGGDVDGSGFVDVDDIVSIIVSWGPCEPG